MKKFVSLILISIILVGCSQNEFKDYKDQYIEE